jgi:competence ComEA-like helix-hairpin-helix protein
VRIYFVDAPEVDGSFKGRMRDQAAYFGIAPEDVPRAGELAARFTFAKLSGREFTVQTRWQNAMGRGKLARFYCEVLVDGKNLGEELVANGLARIYGLRAARPDGTRATTVINQLKNLELIALEQKRGIWDEVQFPRDRQLTTNSPTRINPAHAITADAPLDVNTASYGDLQNLPRIGPKMAQRIIAHRPYQRIEDLQKVPGIGPKTFEQITPFVRVSQTLAP